MPRPTVYIAITSHGFGHAVRAASIAAKIQQLNPDVLLILVTAAPRWLLESYILGDFIHRPRAYDVGVIQSDSLTMDLPATLAQLRQIQQQQAAIIAGEVNFIRQNRVNLMLADVPPLAADIARAAGIPCWMVSNFGWDFIYRDWGGEFIEIADWMSQSYQHCDRLFRLPLHEPMSAFPHIVDTGLTGGEPHYTPAEIRQKFKLVTPPEQTILLSFGGLGLQQIPYENLAAFPDWQFITFDAQAPQLPNLIQVTGRHYRPVDLMPVCGRVVSKPGYSTFAEALRLEIPIVSLTREGFAESPILLAGIRDYAFHQIISPEQFFSKDWDFLNQSPQSPQLTSKLEKWGTEAIARQVVDALTPPC